MNRNPHVHPRIPREKYSSSKYILVGFSHRSIFRATEHVVTSGAVLRRKFRLFVFGFTLCWLKPTWEQPEPAFGVQRYGQKQYHSAHLLKPAHMQEHISDAAVRVGSCRPSTFVGLISHSLHLRTIHNMNPTLLCVLVHTVSDAAVRVGISSYIFTCLEIRYIVCFW